MERVICLLIGYVFGLFQTAYFYGKAHGIDIRQHGSGNSGTTNALRYTKEGDSITVSGVQTKDDVRITVADTGCGIARKDLDHIYDLFYRGTSSRREKGFGIGLSVVKTIVDTMDWKIQVDSEEGEGTVFTIIIPLSQQNEKKALVQTV